MKQQSILLVWDRIGDYHLTRVKACAEIMDGALYTADLAGSDALYKWDSIVQKNHYILSTKPVETSDLWNRFKAFRKIIKIHSIDTVAMPYGYTEYLVFLLYARLNGIKTIVFCESWYTRGKVKDFFKSLLLKSIGNRFFVSGQRAYEHLIHSYHIQAGKIMQGYSVVDNNHFERIQKTEHNHTKKQLLCVARYSKEKNIEFLIRCFAKSTIHKTHTLLLVGDGPCKAELQALIHSLSMQDSIELKGWVTYAELPAIYESATGFVLPSTFEPWGLVVNEAMAAGLPILLSDACGCVPDLVEEGKNG